MLQFPRVLVLCVEDTKESLDLASCFRVYGCASLISYIFLAVGGIIEYQKKKFGSCTCVGFLCFLGDYELWWSIREEYWIAQGVQILGFDCCCKGKFGSFNL